MTENEYWAEMCNIEMQLANSLAYAKSLYKMQIWALNHRYDGRNSYEVKEREEEDDGFFERMEANQRADWLRDDDD